MTDTSKLVEIDHVREKLIDALDAERPAHPETQYDIGYNNGLTMAIGIATNIDRLIANGVTALEWISVKEHLPQDDLPFGALCEIVQVLLDDGTVTVGWCNRGLKCWYYMPINATNFVGHDYDKTPVVAWQPLAKMDGGNEDA